MPKRKRNEMSKIESDDDTKEDIPMPPQSDDGEEENLSLTKDNAKAEIDRILSQNSTSAERFFTDLRPIKRYKRTKKGRRPGICVTTSNMADALGGDIFRALDVSLDSPRLPEARSNTTTTTTEVNNNDENQEVDASPSLPPAL